MGNPYYIPRQNTLLNTALAGADIATRLHGIKTQANTAKAGQALTRADLNLRGDVQKETVRSNRASEVLQASKIGAMETGNTIERDKLRAQGIAISEFKSTDLLKPKAFLNRIDKEYKTNISKAISPIMRSLDDVADSGATKLDIYNNLKQNWQNTKPQVMQNLQEEYNRLDIQGNKVGMKAVEELMKDLEPDGVVDSFFPGVAKHAANVQAELDAKKKSSQTPYAQTEAGVRALIKGRENVARIGAGKTTIKDMTTETRMTAKDVASAEKKIMEGDVTQIGFFNQYAKKPYLWMGQAGEVRSFLGIDKLWPDKEPEITKIQLPKYNGKQVYAADVYQTAIENNMSFEDVLKQIGVK